MYYVLSHNVNIKLQHIDSRLLQHMTLMELGRLEVNNKFYKRRLQELSATRLLN